MKRSIYGKSCSGAQFESSSLMQSSVRAESATPILIKTCEQQRYFSTLRLVHDNSPSLPASKYKNLWFLFQRLRQLFRYSVTLWRVLRILRLTLNPVNHFSTLDRSRNQVCFGWPLCLQENQKISSQGVKTSITAGYDAPIVVELTSQLLHNVIQYFHSQRRSKAEAKQKMDWRRNGMVL